jgi:hypothetical protein
MNPHQFYLQSLGAFSGSNAALRSQVTPMSSLAEASATSGVTIDDGI